MDGWVAKAWGVVVCTVCLGGLAVSQNLPRGSGAVLFAQSPAFPKLAGAKTIAVHTAEGEAFEAKVLQRVGLASGGTAWNGRLVGDELGSMTLVAVPLEGQGPSSLGGMLIRGVVRSGTRVLAIESTESGVQAVELETALLPPCGLGAASRIGRPSAPSNSEAPAPLGFGVRTVLDVLVLYTPAARAGEGSVAAMEAVIELATAEANVAFAESGLDVVVRVVHKAETAYVESGSHFLDMQRLQSKTDGNMDEAHPLRNTFGADTVMLITDTLNTCGNGYLWNDPPNQTFKKFAFSVVSRHCAVSNLSFAHELGHNMGCDHDQLNASSSGGAYSYSHGMQTQSGLWRTVMAITAGTRIPHFSDPSASYQGESIGVPQGQSGAADNVATLKQVAPLVSLFRKPKPQVIGVGMTSSAGSVVTLATSGSSDLSDDDFGLAVTGGPPQQPAIAFFGYAPGALPLVGGTLWVTPPLQRLAPQLLDGSGQASYAPSAVPPFALNEEVFFQTWTSDPGTSGGASLSNAVRVEFYD